MKDINELRKDIDKINKELKELFIKRLQCSENVAKFKIAKGDLAVFDKKREEEILTEILINTDESYKNYLQSQFNLIMRNSRSIQYKVISKEKNLSYLDKAISKIQAEKIFIQGMLGSYSDIITAKKYSRDNFIYKQSFEDIFKEVASDTKALGVLPMVNSTAGMVGDVFQYLYKYPVYISEIEELNVNNCLLARHNDITKITTVISHPQALLQCRVFINSLNFSEIPNSNTAKASEYVSLSNDYSLAAISSPECAKLYNLNIIKENLNNLENNSTKFAYITNKIVCNEKSNRISIIFELDNKTGTLNNVLSCFNSYNVNINALHSMPHQEKPFAFNFYVEFTGNLMQDNVIALLYHLENELPLIKIVGSFEVGK